ncbi:SCO family protein [Aestuariivirga sp.]|uniref:SCO family protein n=1 Tax=Aestuariivirga sp. TaxID=2650926 RepID=UPI003593A903
MPRRSILLFAVLVLAIAMGVGAYALFAQRSGGAGGGGTPLNGGPFSLIDQNRKRVTEKDFLGQYMLVFFGYTYCPDICPTELQVMTAAIDQMGPAGDRITPVFISIDPERDTPEVLRAYVENFGPRLVGLTGSAERIADVAKAYRVYYAKASNSGPWDYLMDHSSIIYLMGPDGRYVKHFTYTADAPGLARDLKAALTVSP